VSREPLLSDPAAGVREPESGSDEPETHGRRVERLFREHNESLLRFLRARLHSPQEAREVAQEAYVQLLGLHSPGTIGFLQGYLFRTAANLATNRLKQRTRRRRIDELVFFDAPLTHRSPEPTWAARQELALIHRAIEELPPVCRAAFLMIKFDDASVDDVARELGLHPRRVRRLVARAIEHCQKTLREASDLRGGSP
jgi:RNA polymerase sigma-70 factor (ECF subfamily)